MIELTFGELKQALICCTVYRNCDNCPLYRGGDVGTVSAGDLTCTGILMSAAWNCINVLEKDLADAVKKAESWEATAAAHEQEIIRIYESFDRK